jgi:ubiquinone biosynthesis protein COQ9
MASKKSTQGKKPSESSALAQMDALLLQVLPHAGELGFGEDALAAGAKAARIPLSRALGLFPNVPADLLAHLANWADRQVQAEYPRASKRINRVRDKVTLGVRLRLEALTPYKDAVRAELRELAKPWHAPQAAKQLFATCDVIWTCAGDMSDDYNYYTKRGLLAGVYASTTLRWLADDSEDAAETWAFLDRRIDNVLQVGKLTGRIKDLLSACRAA